MTEAPRATDRQRGPATAAALRVLADLAPDRRRTSYEVARSGPTAMAWVGILATDRAGIGADPQQVHGPPPPPATEIGVDASPELDALARYDALTPGLDDLRLGWLWVSGTVEIDGRSERLLLPLLSRSARIGTSRRQRSLLPVGPWDLWDLVDDDLAVDLEQRAEFGRGALDNDSPDELVARLPALRTWVDEVLAASGLPPITRIAGPRRPERAAAGRELVAIAAQAVYADQRADPSHPRETLLAWTGNPQASQTAFAHLYLGDPRPPPPAPTPAERAEVSSPLPLTDRQAEVVAAARRTPVTVVSGPPGTGKSQTAAAIALDTVARGERVLVATQSVTAADVLAELLDRVPGPTPILFGGGRRAGTLAAKLADGLQAPTDDSAAPELAQAEQRSEELTAATVAVLDGVRARAAWEERSLTLPTHLAAAPVLFDADRPPGTVVPRAAALLARAGATGGWWARRRAARAERALRELVAAPAGTTLVELAAALDLAECRDRARRSDPAVVGGGADGAGRRRWTALVAADDRRRDARARVLAHDVRSRPDGDARRAVGALAAALRAGRAARRDHLARIDVRQLTSALPLWVGTLGDIETLLPATAGGFDVVILDEASQIDQLAAAGALLRAQRAVVIGDPRQLRFVSFTADRDVTEAIARHHAAPLAARLDVRRISAFDLAASSAPVTFLDEHFRSVPHLIGFSAQRFYDGRLTVATRHPTNEAAVAIEVRPVDGDRTADGVNRAEVAAAVAAVLEALADPARPNGTVGVVSPYRPQVDALREAVGAAIPLDVLQAGRVRVATVHGFQGGECDVVVASFGISDPHGRRRAFLEDPNLFNVLITRARHHLVVLASVEDPPPGLLADYLRWAVIAPTPPPDGPAVDGWTARLAEVLRDGGTPVRTGYPAGTHRVDLVVGAGPGALAVATRVHPDGVAAHLRRHLALDRVGWRQAEAFPVGLGGDAVTTALELADHLADGPE